jgi:hypothetical protein
MGFEDMVRDVEGSGMLACDRERVSCLFFSHIKKILFGLFTLLFRGEEAHFKTTMRFPSI